MNVVAKLNDNGSLDLTVKQGKTLTWVWNLYTDPLATEPMDLTGYSARGQVRKKYSALEPVGVWECTIPDPLVGAVLMTMPASVSASIPAGESVTDPKSTYVYDIELYTGVDPNEVVVLSIGGKYFNDPEATKNNV